MKQYIKSANPKYMSLTSLIGTGEENATSMRELARLCSTSCREIRKTIERARTDGEIICSSDAGYYIPSCRSELVEYYTRTRFRILTSLGTISAIEKYLEEESDDVDK